MVSKTHKVSTVGVGGAARRVDRTLLEGVGPSAAVGDRATSSGDSCIHSRGCHGDGDDLYEAHIGVLKDMTCSDLFVG